MEKQGFQISPMLGTTDLLKTGQASDQNLATSMSSGKQTWTNYKKQQIIIEMEILFVLPVSLKIVSDNQCSHRKKF